MESQFLEHYLEVKKKIIMIILILALLILGIFSAFHNYSNKLLINNQQLIIMLNDLKFFVSQSQLLLKQSSEKETLQKNINESLNTIRKIRSGEILNGFEYDVNYNDKQTTQFLSILENDLTSIQKENNTSQQHLKKLLEDILSFELYHNQRFQNEYHDYLEIQSTTYGVIFLLILFSIFFLKNFNKELENKTLFSHIDKLTHIQNYKGFEEEVENLLYYFERYETPFVMILFDIDGFKSINKKYGRKIGNLILLELSKLVQRKIRHNSDMFFRASDDNFIILCPNISIEDGITIASKLQKTIKEKLHTVHDLQVTISVGVTQAQENDHSKKLYERAKELMFLSKGNGKNFITSDLDIIEEKESDNQE